jgi:putative DNA primase/helicase
MSITKTMLVLALETAAQGLRVLPVSPDTKQPLIKKWTEAATTDADTITDWWQKYPNAMVGVATGGIHA